MTEERNPAILDTLAVALYSCGKAKEAVAAADKAVKLTQEKNPELLDTLAVAFYKNEEPEKAIATIEKALALLPIAQPGRPMHPQAAALREKLEEKLEQFKASK